MKSAVAQALLQWCWRWWPLVLLAVFVGRDVARQLPHVAATSKLAAAAGHGVRGGASSGAPACQAFDTDDGAVLRCGQAAAGSLQGAAPPHNLPRVLVLTPVKNAVHHLDRYFSNLRKLSYPRELVTVGLMDSDSDDAPTDNMRAALQRLVEGGVLPRLRWDDDAEGEGELAALDSEHAGAPQHGARSLSASADDLDRGRGQDDESFDRQLADKRQESLTAAAPPIAAGEQAAAGATRGSLRRSATLVRLLLEVPSLATEFRGVTVLQHNFGLSLSRAERHAASAQLARRTVLARSRNHVLSSALQDEQWVLWVDSDLDSYPPDVLQRLVSSGKQIVVPNCVMSAGGRAYDLNSWRLKALGNDATVAEVKRYHDAVHQELVGADKGDELQLEGYGPSGGHLYLDKLRKEVQPPGAKDGVVRLDAVGGAMLLVDAELHRHGLVFPPMVYRHRIETEGLSMMALDMGVLVSGRARAHGRGVGAAAARRG